MLDLRPPSEFGPEAPDGAYYDVPEAEYHRHPALSRSVVATLIRKSPRHAQYKWEKEWAPDEPGLGDVLHDRVLRPDVFEDRYAQAPAECEGTTSTGKPCSNSPSFREHGSWYCHHHGDSANADDIDRLSESRAEKIGGMVESIRRHETMEGMLFGAAETEVTLLWTDPIGDLRLRARLDAVHAFEDHFEVVDLKSCGSAHPDDIRRQIETTGSWLQPAFYPRGLEILSEGVPVETFIFAAVEDTPPYVCEDHVLDRAQTLQVEQRLEQALRTIAQLQEDFVDLWPTYTDSPTPNELQLNSYQIRRLELPPAEIPK